MIRDSKPPKNLPLCLRIPDPADYFLKCIKIHCMADTSNKYIVQNKVKCKAM